MIRSFDTYYYAFFNFALYSTISVLFVFFVKVLETNGFNNYEIGLLIGVNYLGTFVSPLLFLKYKFNVITVKLSLFVLFLTVLLLGLNYSGFWYIALILFFFGFSRNVVQTYVDTETNRIFHKNYGIIRAFGSAGFLLTTYFIGTFYSMDVLINYIYVLSFVFFVFFVTFAFKHKGCAIKEEGFDFGLVKKFKIFWMFIFVYHLSLGALFSFLTIYLSDRGYEMSSISNVWNVSILAEIAVLFGFVYFKDLMDKYKFVYLSIVLTGMRFLLLFYYPEVLAVVLVAQVLHMFTFGVFHINIMEIIKEVMAENFKMGMKVYFAVGYGLSMALGAYIGGMLYSELFFAYCFGITLLSLFLWGWFLKKEIPAR